MRASATWVFPLAVTVSFAVGSGAFILAMSSHNEKAHDGALAAVLLVVLVAMFSALKASYEKYLIRTGRM